MLLSPIVLAALSAPCAGQEGVVLDVDASLPEELRASLRDDLELVLGHLDLVACDGPPGEVAQVQLVGGERLTVVVTNHRTGRRLLHSAELTSLPRDTWSFVVSRLVEDQLRASFVAEPDLPPAEVTAAQALGLELGVAAATQAYPGAAWLAGAELFAGVHPASGLRLSFSAGLDQALLAEGLGGRIRLRRAFVAPSVALSLLERDSLDVEACLLGRAIWLRFDGGRRFVDRSQEGLSSEVGVAGMAALGVAENLSLRLSLEAGAVTRPYAILVQGTETFEVRGVYGRLHLGALYAW